MESFGTTTAYCSGTVDAFLSGMQMESRRSDLGGSSIAAVSSWGHMCWGPLPSANIGRRARRIICSLGLAPLSGY